MGKDAEPGLAERALGALLGVHAGDALGATVEFMPWAEVRSVHPDGVREIVGGGPFGWAAGHATDDTDLTRALILGYRRAGAGGDVVRATGEAMLDWLRGDWPDREPGSRPRDIGGATLDGLTKYGRTGDPRQAGAGRGKAGNGSLMRCLPTALARSTRTARITEAVELSAITHDDPRCTVACAAYVEMVAKLLAGGSPDDAVRAGRSVTLDLECPPVDEAIAFGAHLVPATMAATGQTFLADEGGGYVLDSLSLAVAALCDPRPLVDVLVDIVRLGMDSDTNGAIAGGLLGARDGAAAIPAAWVARLQFAQEFTAAAPELLALRESP
ncbi:ADP-ribosylglycohydrolase family protein [Spongisporangium articulatum]|uniref:ADP-ribosylglycohydrolase family protein n=1 Tax=Spongisporangium articulatum TaxID=3362603 RepID=A0ABW8AKI1_9ACTN